jgi:hypothetical protein
VEYSAPPLRFKTTPFLDSLSNGLYILPGVVAYAAIEVATQFLGSPGDYEDSLATVCYGLAPAPPKPKPQSKCEGMTWLHHFGQWLRDLMLQVPLEAVRWVFLLLIAALLIWVWWSPPEQSRRADTPPPLTENLKFWASLALGIQLLVYWLL